MRLRSGWFSDRNACYLASSKLVVAQDTGFSNALPTGRGPFAFSSQEEALQAIEAVNADYPAQCLAARRLARRAFAARAVAGRFIRSVFQELVEPLGGRFAETGGSTTWAASMPSGSEASQTSTR